MSNSAIRAFCLIKNTIGGDDNLVENGSDFRRIYENSIDYDHFTFLN